MWGYSDRLLSNHPPEIFEAETAGFLGGCMDETFADPPDAFMGSPVLAGRLARHRGGLRSSHFAPSGLRQVQARPGDALLPPCLPRWDTAFAAPPPKSGTSCCALPPATGCRRDGHRGMPGKRSTPGRIISRLREAEVEPARGAAVAPACNQLKTENARSRKLVAE